MGREERALVGAELARDRAALVDRIVAEVYERVPAYQALHESQLTEVRAIAGWLVTRSLELWVGGATGLAPEDVERLRGVGRARAADGRSIDAVVRAHRVGSAAAVRLVARASADRLDAADVFALSELWLTAIDQISESLSVGHTEAARMLDTDVERARRTFLDDLLIGRQSSRGAVRDRARILGITPPDPAVLVVAEPAAEPSGAEHRPVPGSGAGSGPGPRAGSGPGPRAGSGPGPGAGSGPGAAAGPGSGPGPGAVAGYGSGSATGLGTPTVSGSGHGTPTGPGAGPAVSVPGAMALLDLIDPTGADPLLTTRAGRAVLLVDPADAAQVTAVLGGRPWRGCALAPRALTGMSAAYRLADGALETAPAHAFGEWGVLGEADACVLALLNGGPVTPDAVRRAALGPLLSDGNAHLLETLRTYFRAGAATTAADALHVHPQTLRYRLRQVRELTGHDPHRPWPRFVLETACAIAP
ncbi:helix-turn-helix domain-containing protein [Nocardiopsis sp. NRRL B-16309]|uniref:helix-turn-helix domain-containing protein n=1 Tax=Nocardiopsis sp. NRRL B-16309 TaxID=1519494 RepID=UPI0006AF48FB|nr:PucR family transcriptional regulator [Nocardiopsis sp. NRRL B-16309]KOX12455.1 CdaR family transcriptional regulator [Nocardiopsis sp. NRRL B-16309]